MSSLHNVDPIDPWNQLLVDPTPQGKTKKKDIKKNVDPTVDPTTQKKTGKKDIKRNVDPTGEPTTQGRKGPKILDEEGIWAILCDLRGSIGIDTILGWITTTPPKNVQNLDKNKVEIKRSNIVLAIIKLYRELKKGGYI